MPLWSGSRRWLPFSITLLILTTTACVSSKGAALSATVASRGQDVATAALGFYDAIDAAAARDQRNQLTLRAIVLPPGANLGEVPRQDFSSQLGPRREVYRALKRSYAQLQALAAPKAAGEVTDASAGLLEAARRLSAAPGLSESTRDALAAVAGQTAGAGLQLSVRRHEIELARIAEGLRALWLEDAAQWKAVLRGFTDSYASGVQGLPADVFDEKLAQKAVDAPFSGAVSIRLYQVRMISQAREEDAALETRLQSIALAFDALNAAHAALLTSQPSPREVLDAAANVTRALGGE